MVRKHLREMSFGVSDLLVAKPQLDELSRQVPLLYVLLSVNSLAVAYSLSDSAPFWLTTLMPVLLVVVCTCRVFLWMRRPTPPDAASARRALNRITVIAAILALAFVTWALALYSYGVREERAHIAVFMAVTMIGCIFCLMHLPQAALAVTAVVTIPYIAYSLYEKNTVFAGIAFNTLLVMLVMIRVLMNNFRGFRELVNSKEEMARLGRENLILANTDNLTGLSNRRLFFAELARMLEGAENTQGFVAVGLLDLDRFKPINDTHGHGVGDRLLEAVAQRLSQVQWEVPDLVVSRLGGDEFAFVGPLDKRSAEAVGVRLCEALAQPFELDDLVLTLGASCGVALSTDASGSAQELFNRADYALYQSKKNSRGQVCLYTLDHEREIRSEEALERALSTADLEAEMQLHFQPVVHFDTGAVQFVEALARWNSPVLGPVRPDLFIAAAERMGLIHDLTLVLFRKAVAALGQLPECVNLSFNLSAQDVTNPPTVLNLVSIVRQSGVDPRRIMLELTETAVMRDFRQADQSVTLLRSLGMGIALDDFGTGYSSLSYLHRLPIDKIKIDRSFVHALQDQSGHDLLRSILMLCQSMTLECVVEGVETVEQLATLRELGARAFQGYLFAKPMPMDALLAWIDADESEVARPARHAAQTV
ncbi:putative bifunctional diguanylate cyclase/phosphodiesterase [Aureimonas sp. AU40]|uniref:putative bifunctional diguanylate cyclase/phosphodiesterase n=1 Tax=Aureimonas sp. AU40 TaxID=1637747 RepID=UPI0007820F51|nr:EAL domain-containing protein [Aureimonas sp. AU40]